MRSYWGSDPLYRDVFFQAPLQAHIRDTSILPSATTAYGNTLVLSDCTYFDGDGDYILLASSVATALAAGPVTLEFEINPNQTWVRPTGNNGDYGCCVLAQNNNQGSGEQYINIGNDNQIYFARAASWSPSYGLYSVGRVPRTSWTHVAFVFTGTELRLFLDGKLDNKTSATTFWGNNGLPLELARNLVPNYPSYSSLFNGRIRNVRFTKGVRYLGDFTPPKTLSTHGVPVLNRRIPVVLSEARRPPVLRRRTEFVGDSGYANVALQLPLHAHTRDESKAPKAITLNGDTRLVNEALYLDGSGDSFITTSSSTEFNPQLRFTLEFSYYLTSFSSSPYLCHWYQSAGDRLSLNTDTNGELNSWAQGGGISGEGATNWGVSLALNRWQHLAFQHIGNGAFQIIIDGVLRKTQTINVGVPGLTPQLAFGSATFVAANFVAGYYRNIRYTFNSVRYAYGFLPPTRLPTHGVPASPGAPVRPTPMLTNAAKPVGMPIRRTAGQDPYYRNVLLDFGFSRDTTDRSLYKRSIALYNGAAIAGEALQLSYASSHYAVIPYSSEMNIGSADFTIDFWGYKNTASSTHKVAACRWSHDSASEWRIFCLGDNSDRVSLSVKDVIGAVSGPLASIRSFPLNLWTHIAVTMFRGNLYLFMDGVLEAKAAMPYGAFYGSCTDNINIGRNEQSSVWFWPGAIRDFRFLKGTARWITDFTPPPMLRERGSGVAEAYNAV